MGKKVNPKIFRIGILSTWNSRWFSRRDFAIHLKEDVLIKKFLRNTLKEAGVDKIITERSANNLAITIYAAKPGLIIGRGGQGAEELKRKIQKNFLPKEITLNLNIQEPERPGLSASIVAQNIIFDIEKRIPYRRVMKQAIDRVMKAGAQGVKVIMAGRLDGVEIARTETFASGRVPLHTLRADIDYARGTARTLYGAVGVKVWIYKGEVFKDKNS